MDYSNITVFIIWHGARFMEKEIEERISRDFKILKRYYVTWPEERFGLNLSAFYGDYFNESPLHLYTRGNGQFVMLLCEDPDPLYESRMTSRGIKEVNSHSFDIKIEVRNTLKSFAFHSSNDEFEARRAFILITGRSLSEELDALSANASETYEYMEKDVEGVRGWKSIQHVFYVMNEACEYVLLRNYDSIPDNIDSTIHGDIDILVRDLQETAVFLDPSYDTNKNAFKFMNWVSVNGKRVLFHLKYIGDGYYDPAFQERILESRHLNKNQVYVPSNEMLFWSLLYHGLYHKDNMENYGDILRELSDSMCIFYSEDKEKMSYVLSDWLIRNNYKIYNHLDTDCGRLAAYRIKHPEILVSKGRELYCIQSRHNTGHVVSNIIFDKDIIREEPKLLTRIIKPLDPFLDIERYKLRRDTEAYEELNNRDNGEMLWYYSVKMGDVSELKYVNDGQEKYFFKSFMNNLSHSNAFVDYCDEKKIPIWHYDTEESILKALLCKGIDAYEREAYLFMDYIMEEYRYNVECLDGKAWDAVPKNFFYKDGEYIAFDKEASLKTPIGISHYAAIFVLNVFYPGLPKGYREKMYKSICNRYSSEMKESLEFYENAQRDLINSIINPQLISNVFAAADYHKYILNDTFIRN